MQNIVIINNIGVRPDKKWIEHWYNLITVGEIEKNIIYMVKLKIHKSQEYTNAKHDKRNL